MLVRTPDHFKPLYMDYYLYYVFYGGRGAGKSEEVAKWLAITAASSCVRILCIRESQKSLDESVKAMIEKWIGVLELNDKFIIQSNTILSKSGSKFIFTGMQSYNASNVKSISDVNITWIEEAEAFSQRSWDLLVPSVIRTPNPRIVVTFNPYMEDDVVYTTFVKDTPPPKSYIKKINFYDNIYFKDTALEIQRAYDEQHAEEYKYRHKWLGEILSVSEESLWNKEVMDRLITNTEFNRESYLRVVVACDPATTNKNYSNEYGIIIAGITRDGIIHVIDDKSGNYTPQQFAMQVSQAYRLYNATDVVVEVNNGGDFIKSTLLTTDNNLNVSEVRASRDKASRAIPVANLAYLDRVKHIKGGFRKLERQMRLMSNKGFQGALGESPDRLDAYVWACYHLADLSDKDTEGLVFKSDCIKPFNEEFEKSLFMEADNILYVSKFINEYVLISISIFVTGDYHKVIRINSANIQNSSILDNVNDYNVVMLRNNELNLAIKSELENKGKAIRVYSSDNVFKFKLQDRALKIREALSQNKVYFAKDFQNTSYKNEFGNMLSLQLARYSLDSKIDFNLLDLFCDIIIIEYNLNVKDLV